MSNTKEYILKKATLLFLQKSYKEVTMKEIVEQTGLSKGAFYHYFESKESLFKEIVDLIFSFGGVDYNQLDNKVLEHFIDQYLQQVIHSFQKISVLFDEKDQKISFNFFTLMFDAMKRFPEYLIREREGYKQELMHWVECINNAVLMNEIKPQDNVEELAKTFLYLTDGVFIRVLNNDENNVYVEQLRKSFYNLYYNLKL